MTLVIIWPGDCANKMRFLMLRLRLWWVAGDMGRHQDARWPSGDYFALVMNYSAVAKHAVNLTVHVYSHVPVSLLNDHENRNCKPARRPPDCSVIEERLDADIARTPRRR